jgi:hypothetical protein
MKSGRATSLTQAGDQTDTSGRYCGTYRKQRISTPSSLEELKMGQNAAFDSAHKTSDATDTNFARPIDASSCGIGNLTLADVRSLNCSSDNQKLPELPNLTLEHGSTLPELPEAAQSDASAAKNVTADKTGDVSANKLHDDSPMSPEIMDNRIPQDTCNKVLHPSGGSNNVEQDDDLEQKIEDLSVIVG